ncbi:helix-turn-helix domain-containing protein [Methylobacterium segetis]|uniref:helix-turn-helix domain-containing protein n=1 Tax=Methylobacterium segetis TaxID=2488750 RepID=UPI003CCB2A48
MARAAAKLGVREVAELAGVAPYTVSRFENEQGGLRLDTALKLRSVLEQLGVRLLEDERGWAGVSYRKPEN